MTYSLLPTRRTMLVRALLARACVLALVLGLFIVAPVRAQDVPADVQPAAVQTVVGGNITADTTWNVAGSPYEVTTDITVQAGVTLTIEPGVTVRFSQYRGMDVRGTLKAEGTAGNPILFTGSTATPGWWGNIYIYGDSAAPNNNSVLDYVTIEYAGYSGSNLQLYYATVPVRHATIRNGSKDGIYGGTKGLAHISDSTFTNNGAGGEYYPIRFTDGSVNPVFANLAVSGNGHDTIAVGQGTLTGEHLWEALGIPFELLGDIVVAKGSTLTIQPGVQVRFAQYRGIDSPGTLKAQGTAQNPILFTGTNATPGWWGSIYIYGDSAAPNTASVLDYVTIEYAGYSTANLDLYYATVPVTNSVIRNGSKHGIYGGTKGLAHVANTTLANNGANADYYAIYYTDGSVNPNLANLTVSGNGHDGIALGHGTLTGEHLWESLGIPYYVVGDQIVGADATLTISPGVEVRFHQYRGMDVVGTLHAAGTAASRILFTGTSATPGWWGSIYIYGNSGHPNVDSVLEYITIEYAGYTTANLDLYYAVVPVRHAVIRYGSQDGIHGGTAGVAHVAHSAITNNGEYAINFSDGAVNPTLANLTISDNGYNGIGLGQGSLNGNHVWENAGGAYYPYGNQLVATGATLTIEPGVQVFFAQYRGMDVNGTLRAQGSEAEPILISGTSKEPGWWDNISINGNSGAKNQGSVLEHVTVEYGGYSYANVYLYHALVSISDSVIRQSLRDGVYVDTGAEGSHIEATAIVNNGAFGVRNATNNNALIAANNWWGAPSGPLVSQQCTPGATGSTITPNIVYAPFLTSGDEEVSTVAPVAGYMLNIAPQRWHVPADGVTRADVIVTVRTGEGNPVVGKQIRLQTTLGSVIDGGLTDAHGQARARIYSSREGEAHLTARVDITDPCANLSQTGTAMVRFTPFTPGELTPDAAAPYMDGGLGFNPEPIVEGVPTLITARLVNPNNFPIKVNGTFGIAQSGIGLAFPPVGSIENFEIPANSTRVASVTWIPPISGHYCIRFDYSWQDARPGANPAEVHQSRGTQRNLNVYGGTPNGYDDKDILNKASKAGTYIGGLGNGTGEGFIPGVGATILTEWQLTMGARISRALGGDPPRQDFMILAVAEPVLLPDVQAGGSVTPAMATALNKLRTALAWANANGAAALIDYDRYGGATAANQLTWASMQINSMNDHKREMATYLYQVADAMDEYRAARLAAGIPDAVVTGDNLRAYQERLKSTGFTQEEIDAAHAVGITDAELAEIRQLHIDADPDEITGSFMEVLEHQAAAFRAMADNILWPPTFGLSSVGGSGGVVAAGAEAPPAVSPTNNLARVYEHVSTIEIGNPTASTATIDLRVMPIDLPAGWMATTSPVSVTLGAGEQTSVEVRITPAGPAVQGSTARVAVEGYIGAQLLGGVTVDILVPYNVVAPPKHLMSFLPVVDR